MSKFFFRNNTKLTTVLAYIYTAIIFSIPFLQIYASPIPMISLPEFLMILVIIASFLNRGIDFKDINRIFLPFILYLGLQIVCYFILFLVSKSNAAFDSFGTCLRLCFYYVVIFFSNFKLFNKKFGLSLFKVLALILSIYGLIQVLFANCFGLYLINYIPLLPDMGGIGGKTYHSIITNAEFGITFRPYSFFREPSHFAIYILLALFVILFEKEKSVFDYFLSGILSISIIFTLSSTGIVGLFAIFLFLILKKFITQRNKRLQIGISFGLFILISVCVLRFTSLGSYFIKKTFNNDISIDGLLSSSRFNAILEMFDTKDIIPLLFGNGMQQKSNYLPSFGIVYYGLGVVGYSLFLIIFINYLLDRNLNNRFLSAFLILLNIGTEIALGCFSLLSFSLLANSFITKKERIVELVI